MNPPLPFSSLHSGSVDRRSFLRRAIATGATAALIPAGMTLGSRSAHADDAGDAQDYFILNFALNLEYLEAQFYSLAVTGMTLGQRNAVDLSGFGTLGHVEYDPATQTQVPFVTPAIQQYANEIAADELAHVIFLRDAMTSAGLTPAALPMIDFTTSFDTLAAAAGIGATFNPFVDETSFLLGGFIFEDVGVTAYHGAAPLLTSKAYLKAAAGILAVEAYHASILRLKIFEAGPDAQAIALRISNLRDEVDSPKKDKDQGLVTADGSANIVPTDANGLAFARSGQQVLNIVYGAHGATTGLFFPNGMNLPAA